jgi:hypothetical protein
MITETFTLPFDMFLYFFTTGFVFSSFVHFAVAFVGNLRIPSFISRLFDV